MACVLPELMEAITREIEATTHHEMLKDLMRIFRECLENVVQSEGRHPRYVIFPINVFVKSS